MITKVDSGGGGLNQEFGISIYLLLSIKEGHDENLLCSTETLLKIL